MVILLVLYILKTRFTTQLLYVHHCLHHDCCEIHIISYLVKIDYRVLYICLTPTLLMIWYRENSSYVMALHARFLHVLILHNTIDSKFDEQYFLAPRKIRKNIKHDSMSTLSYLQESCIYL